MAISRGKDDLDFGRAIREGRQRVTKNARGLGCHRVFSYVERGFYSEQIQRLLSLFAPDQLLFLKKEDLWDRHSETLERVCEFLGVDKFSEVPKKSYIVPFEVGDTPPLAPEDRTYLLDLYQEDIRLSQRLTGLDLSVWVA